MKIYLLLIVLLAAPYFTLAFSTFDQYVNQFHKTYKNEEYPIRKNIYDNRISSYSSITAYQPGINNMTDWSQQQIQAFKTLQVIPEAVSSPLVISSPLRLGAPASLDWTAKKAVTSIKNQESCGSCWAFASIAYAESKLIIDGKYTIDNIDLSEQYMLQCTQLSDCQGGYLQYAINQVRTAPTEQKYPYKPYFKYQGICNADGIRSGYNSMKYYNLGDDDLINLLQSGPVTISISSDGWQTYGSGVFQCAKTAKINHAVLLTGYTADYWIIKNQYGQSWGENGYIRISRNPNFNCKIGSSAFTLSEEYLMKTILLLLGLIMLLLF